MRKVILVGYMAVGKTTIAQLISKRNGVKYVDLDSLIEEKTNLTIIKLFKLKGEIYFRNIEHEMFKNLILSDENIVISTGGGTPCYANNHLLLNSKNCISIYLRASLEVILDRLKFEKVTRPLIANKSDEELMEFVAKQVFERSYFYSQATFTIDVSNKSPEIITEEILKLLD